MGIKTNKKHRQKNLKIAAAIVGVALLVGVGFAYRPWKNDRDSKTAGVAQEKNKSQADTTKSSASSGGVVDNNTTKTNTPTAPQPQPQASSAAITLSSPADGALVANGTVLTGMASVPSVQYRFKDADGLDVATGVLSVANSKYSGSVSGLNARTNSGTLEVFNYNANGAEENWVKVNVRYK